MILEAIVTTMNSAGEVNIAPTGPRVDPDLTRFELRLFPSSRTFRNLMEHGEGVVHITDDVLLFARGAIGALDPVPRMEPARSVRGHVLTEACRILEFRVKARDDREERVRFELEIVRAESRRDFFGFNRAKHAVIEAAILATRIDLLAPAFLRDEFQRLEVIVGKTAGPQETEAFALLKDYVLAKVTP